MRIRKRPSSGPQKQRLIQQLPATYKYVFSTGWLLKRAYEEHDKQQSTGVLDSRCSRLPEERGLSLHGGLWQSKAGYRDDGVANTSLQCCRCEQQEKSSGVGRECKQPPQQQHPIGEEAIGEEPRTPPPFCGEKPALARQRSEHELHPGPVVDEKFCSCGKDQQRQKRKQQTKKPIQDLVKGESSGSGRKRTRTRVVEQHQQQEAASEDDHGLLRASSRLRDTAESSGRSSHDNCGPQQRLKAGGGASLGGESYLRELGKMDPLRRALHTVVSEAGIAGLTAREAADRISRRGLLSEADIPRSVKMAKVMRDSPYLLELTRGSKFVLWSTFLEESSRKAGFFHSGGAGAGGDNRAPPATVTAKARRRAQALYAAPPAAAAAAAVLVASSGEEQQAGNQDDRYRAVNGVSFYKAQVHREDHACTSVVRQEVGGGDLREAIGIRQDHREVLGKEVVKRQFFDLNLAPQEQEEEM
ncbi:uncharacterized protein LOC112349380 isoform X2 [Selaginella moellendorffii]|uniref:uncharacterized protein LOC112349380 isoform X2 n=1 Tax=Selaginella moellendorffii TaxID=88036 RepID=UPI000D1CD4F7|nr:uncharacterized protein LOC112349380 isoform X2 [Selaginella moellendorffii]|eukprot:XP_024539467.1 uncharacterized protein LOC112349380 isoform X2 [Selaginella moellendorffii]